MNRNALLTAILLALQPLAAADPIAIEQSIRRGVDFLVADQNENGSWGSARRTKGLNIYAPVPGAHHAFRTAVTALSVHALIETGLADMAGPPADALAKGRAFLIENLPEVRRASADAIYNVWTHAYGISALSALYQREIAIGETQQGRLELVTLLNGQIDRLARYESVDGGWGYYDFRAGTARPASSSISFTTATCLIALHEASEIPGVEIPPKLVDRAIRSIERQKKPDFSYLYGEYLRARPLYGINRPAGSLGRSQACNYALRIWGDSSVTDEVIGEWLERLGSRNGWLDMGRKRPIPHESWFQVAGYFFYYGHYYGALCTDILTLEMSEPHRRMLSETMLARQEKDGSWWDFPFYSYHQPYGTAFALMTLSRCQPAAHLEVNLRTASRPISKL